MSERQPAIRTIRPVAARSEPARTQGPDSTPPDIRRYIGIIGKRWRWVIGAFLFVVTTAAIGVALTEPVYVSYVELQIEPEETVLPYKEVATSGAGEPEHMRTQSRILTSGVLSRNVAEALSRRELREIEAPDEVILVVVGHDPDDVWKRGELGGPPGGIAARHDDAGLRVGAGEASDDLPRALVGRSRHRAGVDDHQIGLSRRRIDRAARAKTVLDAKRVGLVDPATEGNDGVLHAGTNVPAPMSRRKCMKSNRTHDAAL